MGDEETGGEEVNDIKHSFTRAEVDARFAELAALLATQALPTFKQGPRYATADEFMPMHEKSLPGEGRVTGFKHSDTRNYVFVMRAETHAAPVTAEYRLHVPRTGEPFKRGTFDTFAV